jgi:hypothetical protein
VAAPTPMVSVAHTAEVLVSARLFQMRTGHVSTAPSEPQEANMTAEAARLEYASVFHGGVRAMVGLQRAVRRAPVGARVSPHPRVEPFRRRSAGSTEHKSNRKVNDAHSTT